MNFGNGIEILITIDQNYRALIEAMTKDILCHYKSKNRRIAMKNRFVLPLIICITLTACENNKKTTNSIAEDSINSSASQEETNDSISLEEEPTASSVETEPSEVEDSIIEVNRINDESPMIDIYENFIDGKEVASFDNVYSQNLDFDLKDIFDSDKNYNLTEIAKSLHKSSRYYDDTLEPEIYSKYIDCGVDGEKELSVMIDLPEDTWEGFYYNLILKEIDGELQVLYVLGGWEDERSCLYITDKGYIIYSAKVAAARHKVEYSYLDAEVNWHFYYGYIYHMDMDDFISEVVFPYVDDFVEGGNNDIDTHSEEWKDVQVTAYYFQEDDYNKCEHQTFVYSLFDNHNMPVNSIYAEDSLYKKTFDEWGIETTTQDEVDKLLKLKREEIGLDEAIIE